MAGSTAASGASTPDDYVSAAESISGSSNASEYHPFTDAPVGFPVTELLARLPRNHASSRTSPTLSEVTGHPPGGESQYFDFDQPLAQAFDTPRVAQAAAHEQRLKGSHSKRRPSFSAGHLAEMSLLSKPKFNPMINVPFTTLLAASFAEAGLPEPDLLSETTYALARSLVESQPADEHLFYTAKLVAELLEHAESARHSPRAGVFVLDHIERAIVHMVEKDVDQEFDHIGYKEILFRLVVFKNRILDETPEQGQGDGLPFFRGMFAVEEDASDDEAADGAAVANRPPLGVHVERLRAWLIDRFRVVQPLLADASSSDGSADEGSDEDERFRRYPEGGPPLLGGLEELFAELFGDVAHDVAHPARARRAAERQLLPLEDQAFDEQPMMD